MYTFVFVNFTWFTDMDVHKLVNVIDSLFPLVIK